MKYPFHAQRYRTLIIIGISLSILVLLRRWYGFWAVAFFISLTLTEVLYLLKEYGFDRARLLVLSKKVSVTVFASGVFFLMAAAPLLMFFLGDDYSHYTSLYLFNNTVLMHFKRTIGHFGYIYSALTLLGIVVSLYYKNTRKAASFLIIQWVVMSYLFTQLHSFLPQHYYILQPTMLIFIALLITSIFTNIKSRALRIIIFIVCISISTFSFSTVFFPDIAVHTKQARAWFPNQKYYPPVRNDIPEIKRMLSVIGNLLADPDEKLYVLASSSDLNSDTIQKASLSLPDVKDIQKQVYRSSDLDMKDGFPTNLFSARYVLVADPIQYDFDPSKTQVITIPAESILEGKNMGKSYKKLQYEFNLEKGVKVYLYERIGPFNQADVDFLSDTLRKFYPDNPHVYTYGF